MPRPAAPSLPRSAEVAWWVGALLRGDAAPDDVLDAVPVPLAMLSRLRATGARTLGLALPVAGDPVGVGGPPELTRAATAAGEAVVADSGVAWVPEGNGGRVEWTAYDALPRQLPDLGEADRTLRASLLSTADALAALDVARWRPEVADEVLALGRPATVAAPPGVPARCVELAARAARCLAIADLALADDGPAVSASEMASRREALRPFDAAARRALVAACSPECWPLP